MKHLYFYKFHTQPITNTFFSIIPLISTYPHVQKDKKGAPFCGSLAQPQSRLIYQGHSRWTLMNRRLYSSHCAHATRRRPRAFPHAHRIGAQVWKRVRCFLWLGGRKKKKERKKKRGRKNWSRKRCRGMRVVPLQERVVYSKECDT